MNNSNSYYLSLVDHTLLSACATQQQMDKLCKEALEYHTASACIPPSYVSYVKQKFEALTICTVIAFPLGYQTTKAKLNECKIALTEGASEIDMVINLTDLKNKKHRQIQDEIKQMKDLCEDKILKVIIETCYLDNEEIKKMTEIVSLAKADFIKTSTGFGTQGAKLSDIELFKKHKSPKLKIKAAGGIRNKDEFIAFVDAGCDRIGTSRALDFLI